MCTATINSRLNKPPPTFSQLVKTNGSIAVQRKYPRLLQGMGGERNAAIGWSAVWNTQYGNWEYTRTFLVVDALDECTEKPRNAFLGSLNKLCGNVHLLVTSRPTESIKQYFEGATHLEITAHNHDIQLYINGRVAQSSRKYLQRLREEISATIVLKVKGM